MVTQWPEPKENYLKFQNINAHEGFSDTKLAICGIFLKAAPQLPPAHASVMFPNEGFPILIVLNDPRILSFHQIISCLPSESVEVFLLISYLFSLPLSLGVPVYASGDVHILWLESY